jgi:hypothetical protein
VTLTAKGLSSAVSYQDPKAAYRWLETAFGFEPLFVILDGDGNLAHSEMTYGNSVDPDAARLNASVDKIFAARREASLAECCEPDRATRFVRIRKWRAGAPHAAALRGRATERPSATCWCLGRISHFRSLQSANPGCVIRRNGSQAARDGWRANGLTVCLA